MSSIINPSSSSSGGSAHVGTTIIDFGAYPGSSDASVGVTGQTSIVNTSIVDAWIYPIVATTEHSVDEHKIEEIEVIADGSSIIPGTGFTIYARTRNDRLYGQWYVAWSWSTP